jgi:hypothetical protein
MDGRTDFDLSSGSVSHIFRLRVARTGVVLAVLCLLMPAQTRAQVNGQGATPYLGWSSWSQQVVHAQGWLTEKQVEAQSDALKASGLQAHGFLYINIDSGWQSGFDANGIPLVNTTAFPDGMAATIQYIHNNGQKAGIYWIPGVQQPVYDANPPILGTPYNIDSIVEPNVAGNAFSFGQSNPWHKKIDFTQPGAQAYVNSVVNLFAFWGVDLIKLDGVTPGSDHNDLGIDNRTDVAAWSQAIAQSGRPMWLTISWALDHDYAGTWRQLANARRIEDDIDCRCGTLTNWPVVARRFNDLLAWQSDAGPSKGWNDLDSLEVGNGSQDGLTNDERRSAMTLWVIANAPLYLGDDLTQLDSFGLQLLTNDAVLAVDRSGAPGIQIQGGTAPVWVSNVGGGVYYAALFNLDSASSTVSLNWSSVGFSGSAAVRDLWSGSELGIFNGSYSTVLNSHAAQLLRITVSYSSGPSVTAAPTSLTLSSSSSQATSTLTVTPGGSSATLGFACSNLPGSLQCSFVPSILPLAGVTTPQTVTLTVLKLAPSGKLRTLIGRGSLLACALLLALFPPGKNRLQKRRRNKILSMLLLTIICFGLCDCGSSSIASTGGGSSSIYSFNVNVSSGSTLIQTIPFSVSIQ